MDQKQPINHLTEIFVGDVLEVFKKSTFSSKLIRVVKISEKSFVGTSLNLNDTGFDSFEFDTSMVYKIDSGVFTEYQSLSFNTVRPLTELICFYEKCSAIRGVVKSKDSEKLTFQLTDGSEITFTKQQVETKHPLFSYIGKVYNHKNKTQEQIANSRRYEVLMAELIAAEQIVKRLQTELNSIDLES